MSAFHIVADLPNGRPVFVYGASAGGQAVAGLLARRGIAQAAFADTFRDGVVDGMAVWTLDRLSREAPRDAVILVASMHHAEIAGALDRLGFRDVRNAHPLALELIGAARTERIERFIASLGWPRLDDWIESRGHAARTMIVQLSSRCNLRCVYCTQGMEGVENSTDMPALLLDHVVDYVRRHRVSEVHMGVFGETLIFPGWEEASRRLIGAGARLNGTTNLATVLTEAEIEAFSSYHGLFVSLDVMDVPLQKTIRKSVDVRTILFNIQRLRAHAVATGGKGPQIFWNCVVLDQNAARLKEYVATAIACGADGVLFNDVAYYEGLPNAFRSLFDLDEDAFLEAYRGLEDGLALAAAHGVQTGFPNMSHERLARRKSNILRRRAGEAVEDSFIRVTSDNIQGRQTYFGDRTEELAPGETRLCLDPWNATVVMPTGEVHSCCVRGKSMGNVNADGGLDAVFNGPAYADLRRQLLSGDIIDESCAKCLWRPAAAPGDLRRALVETLLAEDAAAAPTVPDAAPVQAASVDA